MLSQLLRILIIFPEVIFFFIFYKGPKRCGPSQYNFSEGSDFGPLDARRIDAYDRMAYPVAAAHSVKPARSAWYTSGQWPHTLRPMAVLIQWCFVPDIYRKLTHASSPGIKRGCRVWYREDAGLPPWATRPDQTRRSRYGSAVWAVSMWSVLGRQTGSISRQQLLNTLVKDWRCVTQTYPGSSHPAAAAAAATGLMPWTAMLYMVPRRVCIALNSDVECR